jgi:4'-phosphopantetheinyl transferase
MYGFEEHTTAGAERTGLGRYMTSFSPLWNVPDSEIRLTEKEVHVWRAPLEAANLAYSTLQEVLSIDEREQARRFAFEKDRRRWIMARGVLRMLLSRYLLVDARELQFSANSYGKPAIAFPEREERLQFNVAHSVDLALYAFGYDQHVGIDVEYMREDVECEKLARSHFSPREYATLQALPAQVQQEAFFLCWSRKEAYLKAKGKGLSIPLAHFDVSLIPGEPAALLASREDPDAPERWLLYDLAPGVNYAGALAVEGIDRQISCWQW